jgi:molecular chaperone HtpG
MPSETFAFQAEINQLMSLIINTFYSNKDIFLRELISNASDAIDKARHNALQNTAELRDYNIKVTANKEDKTLVIEDNGIGLTKEEMVSCLGTIANSGTKQFMEALQAGTDVSMIGQFGVGFYSAYLVASNVKVYSGKYCWESAAGGSFTIDEFEEPITEHGVRIVLGMKEECVEYLEENKIREIVKKHSEFINYPINLWTVRTETKEVPVSDDEEDGKVEGSEESKPEEESEEGKVEDVDENATTEEEKPKTKTVTEEITEWKQLNTQKPIWLRKPDEVTEEEHASFFKSLSNDWDNHLAVKHFSAEGQIEYKSVLYIPKRAPFDMFQSSNKKKNNIKLYVRRVFIMDKCEDLMPEWLNFVSGVVDSEDLPLNVSREMLQQNRIMNVIRKNLVKKCIDMFNEMAEDEDKTKYNTFYDNFQQSLKVGIHEDSTNRDKLVKLTRFYSSNNTERISFEDYVTGMKDGQDHIYFITGESKKAVENSPFVKGITDKGFDVMFMTDPIDEYMCQHVREFDGKKLVNITKDNTLFQEKNEDFENHLCKKIKELIDVEKVVVSSRLGDSPCCLVSGEYGWSANMELIMKAQTLQNNTSMGMMGGKKIMEINPSHPMIMKLQEGIQKSSMNDHIMKDVIQLMYDTAMVASGYSHEDPSKFSSRIYRMIGLGIEADVNVEIEDEAGELEENTGELEENTGDTDVTEDTETVSQMEEVD